MHQKMSGRYVYADVYVCFSWWHWFYALYNTKVLWPVYYEEVQNRLHFLHDLCAVLNPLYIFSNLCLRFNGFFCPEETCRSGPAHLTRSLYICPTPSLVGAKYCSLNNWTCWNWSRFPGHYQDRRMSLPCAQDSSNMKDWSTLANFACMLLET